MITLAAFDLFTKESLRIKVSFEALNGTWSALSPIALIHSFSANKLNIVTILPLVNLRTLQASLSIVTLCILGPLTTCQVHKHKLSTCLLISSLDQYLADSVRSWWCVIGYCGMSCSALVGLVHYTQQLFGIYCYFFCQAWNLNDAWLVLQNVQHGLFIKQVQTSSTINFKKWHCNVEALLDQLEKLLHSKLLKFIHCKCLAWTCLSIGKACHYSCL